MMELVMWMKTFRMVTIAIARTILLADIASIMLYVKMVEDARMVLHVPSTKKHLK